MRLTVVLHKFPLYRMIKQHWKIQRKRVPHETHAEKAVKLRGLEVVDANDVVKNENDIHVIEQQRRSVSGIGYYDIPPPKDEKHPLYHKETCYIFKDNNILLQGLDQASVLTNTIVLDGLPSQVEDLADDETPSLDDAVQRCIKSTFLYDAEQKKLPLRKDPERPAWTFPRDYGVTDRRKNRLLCSRFLQLCAFSNTKLNQNRSVLSDAVFSVPLVIDDNKVQFEVRSDMLVISASPLSSIADPATSNQHNLPDISPLHPLVSFEEHNVYQIQNIFPVAPNTRLSHAHTAIIHFNETEVKNIYDTPVTDDQVISRSLVKSYAIAVAQARHIYGPNVKELQQPITIQAIQTDGQMFSFSILQLNTLSLSGNLHNQFYCLPIQELFSKCEYLDGKPVLTDYNPEVFKRILTFYNNESVSQS